MKSQAEVVSRVLITGVRGKTGVPLARRLTERNGLEVRGGSSNPSLVSGRGVTPVLFSWDEPSTWAGALTDVEAMFIVRPGREDAPQLVEALLDSTDPQTHVVLLSEQAADQAGPDSWAERTERAICRGRQPWTILRPSWFMQVLTDKRFYGDVIAGRGILPFSSGGASVAWIDADDIAAVAAEALTRTGHTGSVYTLTGPEALPLPRTAEELSVALDRQITHVEIPIDKALGRSKDFHRHEVEVALQRVHAGVFADVTGTVEEVTGRPAHSLREFLSHAMRPRM